MWRLCQALRSSVGPSRDRPLDGSTDYFLKNLSKSYPNITKNGIISGKKIESAEPPAVSLDGSPIGGKARNSLNSSKIHPLLML